MKINYLKYRFIYLALSGTLIAVSLFSLLNWGVKMGVEFTGGSLIEYRLSEEVSEESIRNLYNEADINISSVQQIGDSSVLVRTSALSEEQREDIQSIEATKFENIGPTFGAELMRKTGVAIAISASVIMGWVALQFKSIKFGIAAILAMFHDSFILIGSFSLYGYLFDAHIDFLFVTALLTTLSFSVHDTIVVFDRIREIRKSDISPVGEIANQAVSETMRRSINNSVTIALMLVSLMVFGGDSIFWFAVALFTGTVLGTYSSPFVAVPLLVFFDRFNFRK